MHPLSSLPWHSDLLVYSRLYKMLRSRILRDTFWIKTRLSDLHRSFHPDRQWSSTLTSLPRSGILAQNLKRLREPWNHSIPYDSSRSSPLFNLHITHYQIPREKEAEARIDKSSSLIGRWPKGDERSAHMQHWRGRSKANWVSYGSNNRRSNGRKN